MFELICSNLRTSKARLDTSMTFIPYAVSPCCLDDILWCAVYCTSATYIWHIMKCKYNTVDCRCPKQATIDACPTLAALKNPPTSNGCPTTIAGCAALEALACPSDSAIDACPTLAALRNSCPEDITGCPALEALRCPVVADCPELAAAIATFSCPSSQEVTDCPALATLADK
jgi:hypothetical protein